MVIWLSILIPITAIALLYWKFHKKVAWWESTGLLTFSILLIIIMKSCTTLTRIRDVERYQDYVVSVEHHHYWNEWIHQTCSRECCCDSKGENCSTETYDCSYEEEYAPYTLVTTSTGKTFKFYEGYKPRGRGGAPTKYLSLIKKFKTNPNFKGDHRRDINTNYGKGYHGEVYGIKWNGKTEDIEYATWEHTYENRVQASHSIHKFPEVDEKRIKQYGLYEYPKIHGKYKSRAIIGESNSLDEYVNQKNSLIASSKQLKIFYLVYKNQPMDVSMYQEHYWQGGNKNEVNICIGIDDNRNIKWAYVFSWSKNELFKVEIRNYINDQKKLTKDKFKRIIDFSHDNLVKNFKRREFAEFSHLTVDPPTWGVILTFILTILFCVGASIWIVQNEHNIDGTNTGNNYGSRNRYSGYRRKNSIRDILERFNNRSRR